MILYFTGTGNSAYVANRIEQRCEDKAMNLFDRIKDKDVSTLHSETPWIIIAPTYAWRLPHIVEDWIAKTTFTGSKKMYVIMTCGGSIGNAGKYNKTICEKKGMEYHGSYAIVMPDNYIAMYPTPTQQEALHMIEHAENDIDHAINIINEEKKFNEVNISLKDKISSSMVNDLFYRAFVSAKKFYTTNSCNSCGLCTNVCPLHNIHLENGKPIWNKQCTHCMACINRCPKSAIEYGKRSIGLPRYQCPKVK